MSGFINTVDVLGDKAVAESIIDKTITEYNDEYVTRIGRFALYECKELTTVNCPNVIEIDEQGFCRCTNLRTVTFINTTTLGKDVFRENTQLQVADFHKLTAIVSGWAFCDCKSLNTLILRSEVLCPLNSIYTLDGTPIASGTGYIYVPSALVDSYKSATNWSTYAAQFRALEDYTVDGTTTGELDPTKI